MGDQESALRTMLSEALEVCKGRGEWVGAVPENSAVGESAGNGRAERSVQRFEDQLRTLLAELEARIGQQLPSSHPVVSWLVEYTIVILNKYHINDATNETAYYALHGKEASEKFAYFGERVIFHIPARRRANLDLRWSSSIFLGTLMTSNEAFTALPDGDVTRTRAVARLVPNQR